MRIVRSLPLATLLLLFCLPAQAAGTQRLRQTATDFLKGELDGVILDASGSLTPAPVHATAYPTDAFFVWSVIEDRSGRIVAGTGDAGTLFRQDGDTLVPWAQTLALEILSLLPQDDGVLAGSSPDGVVYRVADDGSVEVALDVPQQSIWDLETGSDRGSWLAAAGPGARVVRVSRDRPAGEVLHELAATNATGLLRDSDGLWIATQGPALLFRVEGNDDATPRLIYEAPEEEIRDLVSDGEGGVIVLAVSATATATPPPKDGAAKSEEAVVSRLTWHPRGGGVETIYAGPEIFLSLHRLEDGDLLCGEAESGRVLRIDREGRRSLWVDLEGDLIALAARRDGTVLVGAGNLGQVFELRVEGSDQGSYTSASLAAEHNERWGRVWADGQLDDVRFQTRSGVRKDPDDTWSEWSEAAQLGSRVTSPVAPFVQVRLLLGEASTVTEWDLAYRERNLAPRIAAVRVETPGGTLNGGRLSGSPNQVSQRFDDGLGVEYSLHQERPPTEPETTTWARGLRSIVWKGEDTNGDRLHYRVEVRRLPDGDWRALVQDHPERVYAWDTRSTADGRYRVRVVADDAYDNSAATARTGTASSDVVHVDNTAPRLGNPRRGDDGITVEAEDDGSPLVSVAIRNGDDAWRPLDPVDGVLDGRRESFVFPAADAVWVRVIDAAGNVVVEEIRR